MKRYVIQRIKDGKYHAYVGDVKEYTSDINKAFPYRSEKTFFDDRKARLIPVNVTIKVMK